MKEDITKLKMELEHLERTYKAGIIKEKEFSDNKINIEKKLQKMQQKMKNEEDSKKIIADILEEPSKKEKNKIITKQIKKKQEFILPEKTPEKKEQLKTKKEEQQQASSQSESQPEDLLKTDNWSIAVYLLTIVLIVIILLFSYKYTQSQQVNTKVVTMYEYADYQCPYSKDVQKTLQQLKEYYKDHLIIVHKHFPLEQLYPGTTFTSESAECANNQKAFVSYEKLLYNDLDYLHNISSSKGAFNAELQYLASQLNLNMDQFKACQNNHEKLLNVQKDIEEGKDKGVISTPTFFIGDKKLVGAQSFDVFKYYIEQERKK